MNKELPKAYNPAGAEDEIYNKQLEAKTFKARVNPGKKPYCIVIPPPNITGSLHMGHALNNTIQDILIRTKKMQGFEACWIPGTDHAGIATQIKVEKQIAEEDLTRYDLGREKFLERTWVWAVKYQNEIINQFRKLGISCDWDRLAFTLDEVRSGAVREAFVRLFEKGYIYKDKYIINWCIRCQTAISDLEVAYKENQGNLYYVKYPLVDEKGYITIATTRPETILADTAIAVNPEDEKYKKYIGKKVLVPIVKREIPIIADKDVDPSFGTGALKITPAHDFADYAIGTKHKLPMITVIDEEGNMNKDAGKYAGQDRFTCRENFTADLKDLGLLEKIEDYTNNIGYCQRCNTIVEPALSMQWFMKMDNLAAPAIKAVKEGKVRFIPDKYTKTYLYWMENIRPWCISRQLWWGHRIPVWECQECGELKAYREDPQKCSKCGSSRLIQDPDVLDTWFSSSLWPMSTLGWPKETPDLNYFYPTNVLSTARDIIFLWVARMIMMGIEFKGEAPFSDVYVHATILNAEGKRMSKSLGTGIDPLEIIQKYGADATRFGLMLDTEQGQDIWFSENKIELSRNFANKIWNAARFTLGYVNQNENTVGAYHGMPLQNELNTADKWILSAVNNVKINIVNYIDEYDFARAAKSLYEFFWDDFCDWYIEISKTALFGDNVQEKEKTLKILLYVLKDFLKILHPFMPFLSQVLWENVFSADENILFTGYPKAEEKYINPEAEKKINYAREVIRNIRNIKSELKIEQKQHIDIEILCADKEKTDTLAELEYVILNIARVKNIKYLKSAAEKPKKALSARVDDVEIFVNLPKSVNLDQELAKLNKELDEMSKNLDNTHKKLHNESFISKAPEEVVEKERERYKQFEELKAKITERIAMITKMMG